MALVILRNGSARMVCQASATSSVLSYDIDGLARSHPRRERLANRTCPAILRYNIALLH